MSGERVGRSRKNRGRDGSLEADGRLRVAAVDAIRESLDARGWSQERLGEEIGVSQSVVSQILLRKRAPTLKQLMDISEIVGSTLDWMVKGGEHQVTSEVDGSSFERLVEAVYQRILDQARREREVAERMERILDDSPCQGGDGSTVVTLSSQSGAKGS